MLDLLAMNLIVRKQFEITVGKLSMYANQNLKAGPKI